MAKREPTPIDEVVAALAEALGDISPAVALVKPERSQAVEAAVGRAGSMLLACERTMIGTAQTMTRVARVLRNPLATREQRAEARAEVETVLGEIDRWLFQHTTTRDRTLH